MKDISRSVAKPYEVQLEFADGGGSELLEEIREFLVKKYLQEKIGAVQTEPSAIQFPTPEGEKEGGSL